MKKYTQQFSSEADLLQFYNLSLILVIKRMEYAISKKKNISKHVYTKMLIVYFLSLSLASLHKRDQTKRKQWKKNNIAFWCFLNLWH